MLVSKYKDMDGEVETYILLDNQWQEIGNIGINY